jgi:hypothetical protein
MLLHRYTARSVDVAIPPFSIRVEIRGTGPGSEIWQTGYWGNTNLTTYTQSTLDALTLNLAGYATTWWNLIKSTIYTSYSFNEVRTYYYETNGRTADVASIAVNTPNPGTNASALAPIDTAMVCSLRTAKPGRSHRGRMYIPYHGATQPTGLVVASAATTYNNSTAAMLSAVNTGTALDVVVVSPTLGDSTKVTSTTMDLKPDVQRRRVNRLAGGTPAVSVVTA